MGSARDSQTKGSLESKANQTVPGPMGWWEWGCQGEDSTLFPLHFWLRFCIVKCLSSPMPWDWGRDACPEQS